MRRDTDDLVIRSGLELANYAPKTLDATRAILHDWLEPANPFDFWIGIDIKGPCVAHESDSAPHSPIQTLTRYCARLWRRPTLISRTLEY